MGGMDFAALDWVIEIIGARDIELLIHDLTIIRDNT